jgi:hypothetical protein
MKILLKGNINKTYVQTLCMMFFHGEKFPLDDEVEENYIEVEQAEKKNGIFCTCKLCYNGKVEYGNAFVSYNIIETMERTSKSAVGKAVYQAGELITGKKIPWGILTGIRPSKVANEILRQESRQMLKLF